MFQHVQGGRAVQGQELKVTECEGSLQRVEAEGEALARH